MQSGKVIEGVYRIDFTVYVNVVFGITLTKFDQYSWTKN